MRTDWDDDERDTTPGQGVVASWGAVLRDVRSLAVDLTVVGTEVARQMPKPPVQEFLAGWTRVEDVVLREIKTRLDAVDTDPSQRRRIGNDPTRTPAQLLDDLLGASIDADSARSRDELYRSLLLRLVPDEARILAALADGTPYPLIHVQTRSSGGRTILSNASTVGRSAGVQVPDAVGTYVSHLRALGLAEEGPADDSLSVHYDILLGEPGVRDAEEEARHASRLGAKVVRRTLRISTLGSELWRACRPDDVPEPGPALLPGEDPVAELVPESVEPDLDTPMPGPRFNPDTVYRPSTSTNGVGGVR
ncbi:Abi-alpha family protein [Pseudonocardia spinosispora]|uniref:Abi-alpha family protein n=1 Tax=Pseudonocardia spinosispora TaxID=103441 RepID=UPI000420D523|nr:Abi-alpha family protein [Pseudonocardia spinosispora]